MDNYFFGSFSSSSFIFFRIRILISEKMCERVCVFVSAFSLSFVFHSFCFSDRSLPAFGCERFAVSADR